MRKKQLFLLVLVSLAVVPYFTACFYALPFADDFCFAWTSLEKVDFLHRFLRQYLGFCGRYTADALLCVHPLATGKLLYSQLALFATLLATLAALLLFCRILLQNTLNAAICALTILLFYLCYLPQLAEGVYWVTGLCNYELGFVTSLMHISLLLIAMKCNKALRFTLLIAAAFFLVAAIGVNELNAALIPSYYLLSLFAAAHLRKKETFAGQLFPYLAFFFAIAFIASLFSILSPGNAVRNKDFADRYNFFHSALFSILQTARFVARWLFTVPSLLISALVLARANNFPDNSFYRLSYKLILALLLFTVFMGSFLPYFAMGILGQHRTINYVFFFGILLWLWFLISLSKHYYFYKKTGFLSNAPITTLIMAVSIVFMFFTGNSAVLLRDFKSGSFGAYREEFMYRQQHILKNPEAGIPVLKNVPACFQIVDARCDSTWWADKCMKFFYRDTKLELK